MRGRAARPPDVANDGGEIFGRKANLGVIVLLMVNVNVVCMCADLGSVWDTYVAELNDGAGQYLASMRR